MTEKVAELGIQKEKGWLYYAKPKDDKMTVCRSKMNREGAQGMEKKQREEIELVDHTPEYQKYIYYVDKDGDLSRSKRATLD